jgi:hypothetical protein
MGNLNVSSAVRRFDSPALRGLQSAAFATQAAHDAASEQKENRTTVSWARLKVFTAVRRARLKASKGGYDLQ